MSSYDNRMFSSDLDAYRSDGNIDTSLSMTFTGTLSGGSTQTKTTAWFTLPDLDFNQIFYDNNQKHPNKWRDFTKEPLTGVRETSTPSELGAYMRTEIQENQMRFVGVVFNPYVASRTLQTTVITFRIVAYDSTLL